MFGSQCILWHSNPQSLLDYDATINRVRDNVILGEKTINKCTQQHILKCNNHTSYLVPNWIKQQSTYCTKNTIDSSNNNIINENRTFYYKCTFYYLFLQFYV